MPSPSISVVEKEYASETTTENRMLEGDSMKMCVPSDAVKINKTIDVNRRKEMENKRSSCHNGNISGNVPDIYLTPMQDKATHKKTNIDSILPSTSLLKCSNDISLGNVDQISCPGNGQRELTQSNAAIAENHLSRVILSHPTFTDEHCQAESLSNKQRIEELHITCEDSLKTMRERIASYISYSGSDSDASDLETTSCDVNEKSTLENLKADQVIRTGDAKQLWLEEQQDNKVKNKSSCSLLPPPLDDSKIESTVLEDQCIVWDKPCEFISKWEVNVCPERERDFDEVHIDPETPATFLHNGSSNKNNTGTMSSSASQRCVSADGSSIYKVEYQSGINLLSGSNTKDGNIESGVEGQRQSPGEWRTVTSTDLADRRLKVSGDERSRETGAHYNKAAKDFSVIFPHDIGRSAKDQCLTVIKRKEAGNLRSSRPKIDIHRKYYEQISEEKSRNESGNNITLLDNGINASGQNQQKGGIINSDDQHLGQKILAKKCKSEKGRSSGVNDINDNIPHKDDQQKSKYRDLNSMNQRQAEDTKAKYQIGKKKQPKRQSRPRERTSLEKEWNHDREKKGRKDSLSQESSSLERETNRHDREKKRRKDSPSQESSSLERETNRHDREKRGRRDSPSQESTSLERETNRHDREKRGRRDSLSQEKVLSSRKRFETHPYDIKMRRERMRQKRAMCRESFWTENIVVKIADPPRGPLRKKPRNVAERDALKPPRRDDSRCLRSGVIQSEGKSRDTDLDRPRKTGRRRWTDDDYVKQSDGSFKRKSIFGDSTDSYWKCYDGQTTMPYQGYADSQVQSLLEQLCGDYVIKLHQKQLPGDADLSMSSKNKSSEKYHDGHRAWYMPSSKWISHGGQTPVVDEAVATTKSSSSLQECLVWHTIPLFTDEGHCKTHDTTSKNKTTANVNKEVTPNNRLCAAENINTVINVDHKENVREKIGEKYFNQDGSSLLPVTFRPFSLKRKSRKEKPDSAFFQSESSGESDQGSDVKVLSSKEPSSCQENVDKNCNVTTNDSSDLVSQNNQPCDEGDKVHTVNDKPSNRYLDSEHCASDDLAQRNLTVENNITFNAMKKLTVNDLLVNVTPSSYWYKKVANVGAFGKSSDESRVCDVPISIPTSICLTRPTYVSSTSMCYLFDLSQLPCTIDSKTRKASCENDPHDNAPPPSSSSLSKGCAIDSTANDHLKYNKYINNTPTETNGEKDACMALPFPENQMEKARVELSNVQGTVVKLPLASHQHGMPVSGEQSSMAVSEEEENSTCQNLEKNSSSYHEMNESVLDETLVCSDNSTRSSSSEISTPSDADCSNHGNECIVPKDDECFSSEDSSERLNKTCRDDPDSNSRVSNPNSKTSTLQYGEFSGQHLVHAAEITCLESNASTESKIGEEMWDLALMSASNEHSNDKDKSGPGAKQNKPYARSGDLDVAIVKPSRRTDVTSNHQPETTAHQNDQRTISNSENPSQSDTNGLSNCYGLNGTVKKVETLIQISPNSGQCQPDFSSSIAPFANDRLQNNGKDNSNNEQIPISLHGPWNGPPHVTVPQQMSPRPTFFTDSGYTRPMEHNYKIPPQQPGHTLFSNPFIGRPPMINSEPHSPSHNNGVPVLSNQHNIFSNNQANTHNPYHGRQHVLSDQSQSLFNGQQTAPLSTNKPPNPVTGSFQGGSPVFGPPVTQDNGSCHNPGNAEPKLPSIFYRTTDQPRPFAQAGPMLSFQSPPQHPYFAQQQQQRPMPVGMSRNITWHDSFLDSLQGPSDLSHIPWGQHILDHAHQAHLRMLPDPQTRSEPSLGALNPTWF